jgi:hypothetical protein
MSFRFDKGRMGCVILAWAAACEMEVKGASSLIIFEKLPRILGCGETR